MVVCAAVVFEPFLQANRCQTARFSRCLDLHLGNRLARISAAQQITANTTDHPAQDHTVPTDIHGHLTPVSDAECGLSSSVQSTKPPAECSNAGNRNDPCNVRKKQSAGLAGIVAI